jgi:hypothetical protein
MEDPPVRMHHVWSAFSHQIDKRVDHPRIWDRRVKWSLRISRELVQCPTPASNPMNRNVTVHFSAGAARSCKRDDFDIMTAPNKLMRQHAHVESVAAD